MRARNHRQLAVAIISLALLVPRVVNGQSEYTLVELAPGAGGAGPASDINDSGQVVGYIGTTAG